MFKCLPNLYNYSKIYTIGPKEIKQIHLILRDFHSFRLYLIIY